ncbi:MAG: DUF2330 domain-containing protein [Pseudomonadota bacterium]
MNSSRLLLILVYFLLSIPFSTAWSCGGFFCQQLPINQAAEQIVFRQEGSQITTMVQITYSGTAENFGWVLPVPTTPELSIGNNQTFLELERVTRPQFLLTREGNACPVDSDDSNDVADGSPDDIPEGVNIEEALRVGPFDALIISSDDPNALAAWLADNNLDLSSRGEELLAPYIAENMKFVVLRLQRNRAVGDIQPIILKYESDKPSIPIKLTAVAAEDDMGVLVWLLGSARAVPDNYLHVIPNYTLLNWYAGSRNAYASYQNLVTVAMNEAGGQGFASDYAGNFPNLTSTFTTSQQYSNLLNEFQSTTSAAFISAFFGRISDAQIQSSIQTLLPHDNVSIYFDPEALSAEFTSEQLDNARTSITDLVQNEIIPSFDNSLDILNTDLYLTRLYTTLSADEMISDPTFVFNSEMEDQPLQRRALLQTDCTANGTRWTLTLGEGTDREGELVIDAYDDIPSNTPPELTQNSAWQIAKTDVEGSPEINSQEDFPVARIGDRPIDDDGGGALGVTLLIISLLIIMIGYLARKLE